MSVVQEHEDTEPPSADSAVACLDEILQELAGAVLDSSLVSDAARIDRIARLEKLRAVTAALQAAESVRFAQSQAAEQIAADVHPDALGRGIADQIGLACRISPFAAARRLNVARVLWFELPDTYGQLVAGELHERVAENIVTETRHLDPEMRRQVDEQLKTAGIARWDSRPLRHVPARPRTRPIARVMCSGAAPSANIAGLESGQHPTPCRSSAATSPSSRASPATPRCGNTPTPPSRREMNAPATKSWPTPSWGA